MSETKRDEGFGGRIVGINRATAPRRPRGHGLPVRGLDNLPVSRSYEGRFGRMFRLRPFAPDDKRLAAIADVMREDLAGAGGPPPRPDLDNPTIPSGFTYLGQFIDHDLTFDPVSTLTRQADPDALRNFRTPRFDLDSLYGRGPSDDPFLYDQDDPDDDKLLVGSNGRDDDLPRNSQGRALIGDPRNDENTFVSQLHLTFIKFHNAVVDEVRKEPTLVRGDETTFEAAQRIVRWHYQWVVVHDFLPRIVGKAMMASVLPTKKGVPEPDLRFYDPKYETFMPVEFSVAAYRFGHSMIRGRYRLNDVVGAPPRGPLPVFQPGNVVEDPLGHFGGFRPLPDFWTIQWSRFFEVDGPGSDGLQPSRKLDVKLADPLATLPKPVVDSGPTSLAMRNLQRGVRLQLPSGQDVARRMRVKPLTTKELGLPGGGPAPLWYYVLAEASAQANGEHLGEVGGRIVAEVFVGLLERDPSSYLRLEPTFTPFLGTKAGTFTMVDLLKVAGHGV